MAADARACDIQGIENERRGRRPRKTGPERVLEVTGARVRARPRSHRRARPRPASPSDRAPCAWASVRAGEAARRTLARATSKESRTSSPARLFRDIIRHLCGRGSSVLCLAVLSQVCIALCLVALIPVFDQRSYHNTTIAIHLIYHMGPLSMWTGSDVNSKSPARASAQG